MLGATLWYSARPGRAEGSVAQGPPERLVPEGFEGVGLLYSRDLLTRSAALMWLAWMLGGLLSWKLFTAYGRASALEWQFLGAAVWGTGLVFLSRARRPAVRAVMPGLFVVALAMVLMTCAAYGLVPGVSIRW